jgi:hypothetical protein
MPSDVDATFFGVEAHFALVRIGAFPFWASLRRHRTINFELLLNSKHQARIETVKYY